MKKVLSWIIAIGFSGILVQPVQWLLGLIPWEKFKTRKLDMAY